ncbi:MAG: hypothetical protein WAW23_11500 [Candidatus Methanoperedens sp.]
MERKYFLGLQKLIYHKNNTFARKSLEILRKMPHSPVTKQVEVNTDVWKSMYPFLCDQALSTSVVSIDSLKILDVLVDYDIVGDYKNLQKVLLHKSDTVAKLAFDVLRKIEGVSTEPRIERVKPVIAESMVKIPEKKVQQIKEIEPPVPAAAEKTSDIQSKILNVLKKNPKYVDSLREIKSKYNV